MCCYENAPKQIKGYKEQANAIFECLKIIMSRTMHFKNQLVGNMLMIGVSIMVGASLTIPIPLPSGGTTAENDFIAFLYNEGSAAPVPVSPNSYIDTFRRMSII